MSMGEGLSADENRAYELIVSQDGLLQSELWKELDVSSRKGSRLATSLVEKGRIEREQTTNPDGQRTYLLIQKTDDVPSTTRPEREPTKEAAEEAPADGRDARKERALSLIHERGGIHQSEFWKALDVSSRTGSRIATSLEEAGEIRREKAIYNGQQTYLLIPATKELDFSLLMAGEMISPLVGNDEDLDPVDAEEFTEWILQLAQHDR